MSEVKTGQLVTSFNDDDWYEFDTDTRQLLMVYHCKSVSWTVYNPPKPKENISIFRGMKAKHMGLWVGE